MEEKLTFEQSLQKLEAIVKELENGALHLDDAVSKYQEGVALASFCSKELKKAEEIVVKLMSQGELIDFEELKE